MSEKLGFIDAVATVLRKYAVFKGTASRSEYWYFVLFLILVSIAAGLVDNWFFPRPFFGMSDGGFVGFAESPTPFSQLVSLALLLPTLGVTARRFHDAGHSAKWLYLLLIPVGYGVLAAIGSIIVIFSADVLTFEVLLPLVFLLLPMILTMLAVGIVFLAFSLQPSRSFFDGNKYAEPYVPRWPDGLEGTTS